MARTVSATRRESYAVVGTGLSRQRPNVPEPAIARAESHRVLVLVVAATLTLTGIAAPHMSDGTLSSLLFVLGAGLILFLLTGSRKGELRPERQPVAPPAPPAIAVFPELCAAAERRAALDPTAVDRAAWARLTAHMSHEFRTPLNAVLGFSELMSTEALGPIGSSCYGDYARSIHASGRMLLKSAEDALAITALLTAPDRKGPAPATHLRSAIDEALAFHRAAFIERDVAVALDIDPDCEIQGDAQTIRQVLINLLADAAQSASDGATIRVGSSAGADAIRLAVTIKDNDLDRMPRNDTFTLLLAHTLCELSGARLSLGGGNNGSADWHVAFQPAAQRDLFAIHA